MLCKHTTSVSYQSHAHAVNLGRPCPSRHTRSCRFASSRAAALSVSEVVELDGLLSKDEQKAVEWVQRKKEQGVLLHFGELLGASHADAAL